MFQFRDDTTDWLEISEQDARNILKHSFVNGELLFDDLFTRTIRTRFGWLRYLAKGA